MVDFIHVCLCMPCLEELSLQGCRKIAFDLEWSASHESRRNSQAACLWLAQENVSATHW
jgi:hypothetical protein